MKQLMKYILDRCEPQVIDDVLRNADITLTLGDVNVKYIGGGMVKTPAGGNIDLDPAAISTVIVGEVKVQPIPELSTEATIAAKAEADVKDQPEAVKPEAVPTVKAAGIEKPEAKPEAKPVDFKA